jgi:hypothetical protein
MANNLNTTVTRWVRALYLTVPGPEISVALVMLEFVRFFGRKDFNYDGRLCCWPSHDTLAQILGRHRISVQHNVTKLVEAGILSKEKSGRGLVYTFEPRWLTTVEKNRDERWELWPTGDGSEDGDGAQSIAQLRRNRHVED